MPIPPRHLHQLTASPHSLASALPHPGSSFLQMQYPKLIPALHVGTHSPDTSPVDSVMASVWLQGTIVHLCKTGSLQCTVGKKRYAGNPSPASPDWCKLLFLLSSKHQKKLLPQAAQRQEKEILSTHRFKLIQPLWVVLKLHIHTSSLLSLTASEPLLILAGKRELSRSDRRNDIEGC